MGAAVPAADGVVTCIGVGIGVGGVGKGGMTA